MIHYVYLRVVIITEGNNTYTKENIILDIGKRKKALLFQTFISENCDTAGVKENENNQSKRMGLCTLLSREVLHIKK